MESLLVHEPSAKKITDKFTEFLVYEFYSL